MVGFIRSVAQAVKYVIGAEKQQPHTGRFGSVRNVDRAGAVHSEGEVTITLAAVDIGVSGGQDDRVWPRALDCGKNLLRVANVGVLRPEADDFVRLPFADQGLAKQTRSAKDSDSHAQLLC